MHFTGSEKLARLIAVRWRLILTGVLSFTIASSY